MQEIGGYFQLEEMQGKEFYADLVPLNTARNAMLYLIKAKKIRKIYIPFYLCDVIGKLCDREQIQYEYYQVSEDMHPVFLKDLEDGEAILIVNYYGRLSHADIAYMKEKYERIIIDNTHAFFQQPLSGIDTIYNCRKFFGVPDGAYLATDVLLDEEIATDFSMHRMMHLLGRYEKSASEFYDDFKRVDTEFEEIPLRKMSKLTHNLLRGIDYEVVKRIRTRNFEHYKNRLDGINRLKLKTIEGAFAYPLYIENAPKIRQYLIKENVYVPQLWPNVSVFKEQDENAFLFANNILPLPCDQRLGQEEIDKVIQIVERVVND